MTLLKVSATSESSISPLNVFFSSSIFFHPFFQQCALMRGSKTLALKRVPCFLLFPGETIMNWVHETTYPCGAAFTPAHLETHAVARPHGRRIAIGHSLSSSSTQMGKKLALDALGLACEYLSVTNRLEWPRVSRTNCAGAL